MSLDTTGTDCNQFDDAATSAAAASRPSKFSATADSGHRDESAVHQLPSKIQGDGLGSTYTQFARPPAAAAAVASKAIDPALSTAAGLCDTNADASLQARKGRLFIFTRFSSAAATSSGTTNSLSVPHPALRSRFLLAAQRQRLQHPHPLPSRGHDVQSNFFYDRLSSAAPGRGDPQLMAPESAVAHEPGGVASVRSENELGSSVLSPTTTPPVATAAQICLFSNKALNARPRAASFTYASLSDSQLVKPSGDPALVLGSGNSRSPTAPARSACMSNKSAARGVASLSPSCRRPPPSATGPRCPSTMGELKDVAVGDAGVKVTQHIRGRSTAVVPQQQPRQASTGFSPQAGQAYAQGTRVDAAVSGTNGYQSGEPGVDDKDTESGPLFKEDETSEEHAVVIPFTPQAAAGAAGIEIGPASGEWNLPRVQQRILAARLQAEVHQHFTSAVEILLSVQMSLDVDYQEASRGGEPASGFSLTPAQRAYYANLVGGELQYVAALWTKKLQIECLPMHTAMPPVMNQPQAAAGGIAVSYAALPGTANAAGAERGHSVVPPGNTRDNNSATVSESRPHSTTPVETAVEVSVTCTGCQSTAHSPRRRIRNVLQNAPLVQACASCSLHPRDRAADDLYKDGSEASQMSSNLGDANNIKAWASFSHISASSESGTPTTSRHESTPSICTPSARSALTSTTESAQRFERPPLYPPKRTRNPISRTKCLIEAISSESSILKELSVGWDDEVLGSKPRAPFEKTVIEFAQRRSAEAKRVLTDAPPTIQDARCRSSSRSLSQKAEGSDDGGTNYHSSLAADTSTARDRVRQASIRSTSSHLRQRSSLPLLMSSVEQHAVLDAVGGAATSGHKTASAAVYGTEDAASEVSPHVRRSAPLFPTASSDAVSCSSQDTPEKHRPAFFAETEVDAAAALACGHRVSGRSLHPFPLPSEPITTDRHAVDSTPAAAALPAAATTSEATAETQSAGVGDADIVPGSQVAVDHICQDVGADGHDEINVSYTISSENSRRGARQRVVFTEKQPPCSEVHSAMGTSCDTQLSAHSNTSSAPDSTRDRSSGNDYSSNTLGITCAITATSATDNFSPTGTAPESITRTAASDLAGREEVVCSLLVHDPAGLQPSAPSSSCSSSQDCPDSARHSPDAALLRSALPFPTAPSTSVLESRSACVPYELTDMDSCPHGCQHEHPQMQHLPEGALEDCPENQDTRRFLSPPPSTSSLSTREEEDRPCLSPSCTQTHYAYHYKTIVGSDGQPYKRLILCRYVPLPPSTRAGHARTSLDVPIQALNHRGSELFAAGSDDPTSTMTSTHPQPAASVPVEVIADKETPAEFPSAQRYHEDFEAHNAVEILESPVAASRSSLTDEPKEPLPQTTSSTVLRDALRTRMGHAASVSSNAGDVDCGNRACMQAAVGVSERGVDAVDGKHVRIRRVPLSFSGDVVPQRLEEEGYTLGDYHNPYRVKMDRAIASALKWRGPPVWSLRGSAGINDGDVAVAQGGVYRRLGETSPAVKAALGALQRRTAVSWETIQGSGCARRAYGNFTSAFIGPIGVHSTVHGG
ncbi:hypothetical protein JKF63_04140 [Porcisia hertigi]|uniref:Uncharacterized protein n=1 Tax=Porcisia hertigi TaxID=2761500 RepID=A0A836IDU3_9TRYP|nr:hypothetical protein JKF63_04140 [Porcisia hertigi]